MSSIDISIGKRPPGGTPGADPGRIKRAGRRNRTKAQRDGMALVGFRFEPSSPSASRFMQRIRLRKAVAAGKHPMPSPEELKVMVKQFLKKNKITKCPRGWAYY